MAIQDSYWFQRLPSARAADQRGQNQGIGTATYGDPMASNPVYGNVIGGYDYEPMPSQTFLNGTPVPGAGSTPAGTLPSAMDVGGQAVAAGAPVFSMGGQNYVQLPDGTWVITLLPPTPPGGTAAPAAGGTQPPAPANTNPNSPANQGAAAGQAAGQNVPTGGSSPQQPSAPVPPNGAAPRAPAGGGTGMAQTPDVNTLAGMMALNPQVAAQILSYFATTLNPAQAPANPQPDQVSPQQNRNISGINFRFG